MATLPTVGVGTPATRQLQRQMTLHGSLRPQPTPTTPAPAPAPAPAPVAPMPVAPVGATPVPAVPEVLRTDAPPPNNTVVPPIPVTPAPTPSGVMTGNGTVIGTPTNPTNPLTAQTLSVAPTVDRFKIAEDRYNAGEPQYQAALRSAQQRAFGAGRGVSGALRTSLGDAASAREGQRVGFLSDALQGTIDDAYRNVGIAQQQQGFQQGQQDRAFDQDFRTRQLQEALTSGAFGRALQQAQFGYGNDPSQIGLILSQIFGNQANVAGDAAAGLFNQQGRTAGGAAGDWATELLRRGIKLPQGAPTTGAENLPSGEVYG